MIGQFHRIELLLGKDAIEKLKKSYVAVFGIGGVGSYAVEALVRAGVSNIDIYDADTIEISNLNRQLFATTKTIGMDKIEVARGRLTDINPSLNISTYKIFLTEEKIKELDLKKYDYLLDAIDTVSAKIALAVCADEQKVKMISAMGAGNKLDPTAFKVADIYETSVCSLAKVMRTELRKRNVGKLKVVYSEEKPLKVENSDEIGSVSFVPPVVGMIMAGEVIKDLIKSDV